MSEKEKKEIVDAVIRGVTSALEQFAKREQEAQKPPRIFLDGKEITLQESN